jgi:hypothetical protein
MTLCLLTYVLKITYTWHSLVWYCTYSSCFKNMLRKRYFVRSIWLFQRLEMALHSTARVVLRVKRGDRQSNTAALSSLHWRPTNWRIQHTLLVVVFKFHLDKTPTYIASWITSYVPRCALRSSDLTNDDNRKDESNFVFDYLEGIIENNVFPETIIEEELVRTVKLCTKIFEVKWMEYVSVSEYRQIYAQYVLVM